MRRPKSRKETDKSSPYFRAGAIALVFIVIGYQTALFVNRAAILRIEALRDSPDTVYIYQGLPSEGTNGHDSYAPAERPDKAGRQEPRSAGQRQEVRREAQHSPAVQKVREQTRKVESFRFNPNTASVEELIRLGLSPKQAAAIESYRSKGGRFARKSDFQASYVVSDSLYRRLEKYIDIPLLDINKADSAAFDALPGIGPYFASRMVSFRSRLGGYSCKEQLMDIYNFSSERYEGLQDLISCSRPKPYPLWRLGADSLRLHPYIDNYQAARAIVLLRDNTPRDSLKISLIEKAGILSEEQYAKLSRCVIENP